MAFIPSSASQGTSASFLCDFLSDIYNSSPAPNWALWQKPWTMELLGRNFRSLLLMAPPTMTMTTFSCRAALMTVTPTVLRDQWQWRRLLRFPDRSYAAEIGSLVSRLTVFGEKGSPPKKDCCQIPLYGWRRKNEQPTYFFLSNISLIFN